MEVIRQPSWWRAAGIASMAPPGRLPWNGIPKAPLTKSTRLNDPVII
jgi:hypothetical protein